LVAQYVLKGNHCTQLPSQSKGFMLGLKRDYICQQGKARYTRNKLMKIFFLERPGFDAVCE